MASKHLKLTNVRVEGLAHADAAAKSVAESEQAKRLWEQAMELSGVPPKSRRAKKAPNNMVLAVGAWAVRRVLSGAAHLVSTERLREIVAASFRDGRNIGLMHASAIFAGVLDVIDPLPEGAETPPLGRCWLVFESGKWRARITLSDSGTQELVLNPADVQVETELAEALQRMGAE